MGHNWKPFVSYNLWSLFEPAIGHEEWHCPMKRGFEKARKKERAVASLLSKESEAIKIGHLAQHGVYAFHEDPSFLERNDGVCQVAKILALDSESEIVRDRVLQILNNYNKNPILSRFNIIHLLRGDEDFPQPILLRNQVNLYAAIDCIVQTSSGVLHIIDFKTGSSDFDRRQAFVYLLAARYLYPDKKSVASFYNLESKIWSKKISATETQLNALEQDLIQIAKIHQNELDTYRFDRKEFSNIYHPRPGSRCSYCKFQSICDFSFQ